jgi:prepilin-type N-terminal cleavage/methylation domain-containing protein
MKRPNRTAWQSQRGVTLLELVVAMALALLVMAMVFGIHYQTSQSLRGIAKMSEHTDGLVAARELISGDIRTAGSYLPTQGLRVSKALGTAGSANLSKFIKCQPAIVNGVPNGLCQDLINSTYAVLPVVSVRNGFATVADVSDQILTVRGVGEPVQGYPTTTPLTPLVFQDAARAAALANAEMLAVVAADGDIGCLVKPGAIGAAGGLVLVTNPANYNPATAVSLGLDSVALENAGLLLPATVCPWSQPAVQVIPVEVTGYFLPANDRYLQRMSTWAQAKTGVNAEAIGADFTTLQFAVRYYESSDNVEDADVDGDSHRDWYGANQQPNNNTLSDLRTVVAGPGRPADGIPIAVGVTVERRSTKISGIATTETPLLSRVGAPNMPGQFYNNALADGASINLTTTGLTRYTSERNVPNYLDPDRNGQNDGLPYIYQTTTSVVAMRNAGGAL